jgi:hypothetical protein
MTAASALGAKDVPPRLLPPSLNPANVPESALTLEGERAPQVGRDLNRSRGDLKRTSSSARSGRTDLSAEGPARLV